MGYMTKYGSFWGVIPVTSGRVFWVAPSASYTVEGRAYPASDNNDGLSPERALLTLNQAVANATASVGDVIVLLPGSHSWAVQGSISKAGLTVTGIPSGKGHPERQRTSVTLSAADEILGITAARVEVAHIHFVAVTAQAAIEVSANHAYIHDCSFDMFTAAANTATIGIASIASITNLRVENCYFESQDAQGPYMQLDNVSYGYMKGIQTRHKGSTALADGFQCTTGAVDIVFENVRMVSGTSGVVTDSFDWTGSTTDGGLQLLDVLMSKGIGVPNGSADADIWVSPTNDSGVLFDASGQSVAINTLNAS
jgi:hypothetical protein